MLNLQLTSQANRAQGSDLHEQYQLKLPTGKKEQRIVQNPVLAPTPHRHAGEPPYYFQVSVVEYLLTCRDGDH